ncbi:MAG TPA: TRAP transporter small permease [Anaerolineales bacterium]
MSWFLKAYDGLLAALAALSAAAFGGLSFIIAYEVIMRSMGFRPPVWPETISEFTLLYATVLAAPWVLRRAEHVQVTTLIAVFAPRIRAALARIVSFIGMVICMVVAWYALRVTLTAQGLEIRSFEMPKWIVYAPLPLGFFLLAIEFARHMLRGTLFSSEEIEYFTKRRAS